jgi:hypothetical protein
MRYKLMKKHEKIQPSGEPMIISLEAARQTNARPDDDPPDPSDGNDTKPDEAFWAGRNNAMRRSARWVA